MTEQYSTSMFVAIKVYMVFTKYKSFDVVKARLKWNISIW